MNKFCNFTSASTPLFGTEAEEAVFKNALAAVPRCARECLPMYVYQCKCEEFFRASLERLLQFVSKTSQ